MLVPVTPSVPLSVVLPVTPNVPATSTLPLASKRVPTVSPSPTFRPLPILTFFSTPRPPSSIKEPLSLS